MPRLHWCTTWTLWNYLVWQHYSDLPLNTLELHDKITLIHHLNTLELLGMPSLHWSTTWTPWNSIGSILCADWVDQTGTAALTYLKFLSMTENEFLVWHWATTVWPWDYLAWPATVPLTWYCLVWQAGSVSTFWKIRNSRAWNSMGVIHRSTANLCSILTVQCRVWADSWRYSPSNVM